MILAVRISFRDALTKSYRFSNGSSVRGTRRVRSQARDGREQRQMQQLSASPGSYRRRANSVERYRQRVAAGAGKTGRTRFDTERSREASDWHDDDQHASFLHNVVAGQRGEHRAEGRLPDERLAPILDTAQENILVADTRYGMMHSNVIRRNIFFYLLF